MCFNYIYIYINFRTKKQKRQNNRKQTDDQFSNENYQVTNKLTINH